MVSYLDETWGRWLRSTGVDPARLACLVATIGDLTSTLRLANSLAAAVCIHAAPTPVPISSVVKVNTWSKRVIAIYGAN